MAAGMPTFEFQENSVSLESKTSDNTFFFPTYKNYVHSYCIFNFEFCLQSYYEQDITNISGLGRIVGIATAYRLDGPVIKSRWG
jgi:hypothetical protein